MTRLWRKLTQFILSKMIVDVSFIDKRNIKFFSEQRTIKIVRTMTADGKIIDFHFKEDRRHSNWFLNSYIIEARIDERFNDKIKELNNYILISVHYLNFGFGYRTISRVLIDRYMDEALKYYKSKE